MLQFFSPFEQFTFNFHNTCFYRLNNCNWFQKLFFFDWKKWVRLTSKVTNLTRLISFFNSSLGVSIVQLHVNNERDENENYNFHTFFWLFTIKHSQIPTVKTILNIFQIPYIFRRFALIRPYIRKLAQVSHKIRIIPYHYNTANISIFSFSLFLWLR